MMKAFIFVIGMLYGALYIYPPLGAPMPKNSHLARETELVKELFAALNRNDIPAIRKFLDPQIVRIEFEGSAAAVNIRGLDPVMAHFTQARSTWAEGACEPERFFVAGDKIVVFVHVRVRIKDKQEWAEGRVGEVFTFRSGLITQMRVFSESKEALKWVGIKPKDPLEGITLEKLLTALVEEYGWEGLGDRIRINCFLSNPSIKSSLTFLRRTPWARAKVEELYLRMMGK